MCTMRLFILSINKQWLRHDIASGTSKCQLVVGFPSVSTRVPLQVVETPRRKNGRAVIGNPEQSSEKAVAPHSSTRAWKIPRMEGPGGLQSMGSLRVGHD